MSVDSDGLDFSDNLIIDDDHPEVLHLPTGMVSLPRSSAPNFTLYRMVRYLRPLRVLEIGTQTGASAVAMALAFRDNEMTADITCVDPFYPTGDNDGSSSLSAWYSNVYASGLKPGIQLLLTTSQAILPELNRTFDFAFVDGSHLYSDVRADLLMTLSLLSPGGYLVAHDYVIYESVRRACDEIVAEHCLPFAINDLQKNQRGELCGWIVMRRPMGLSIKIQTPSRECPPQKISHGVCSRLKAKSPLWLKRLGKLLLGRGPRA